MTGDLSLEELVSSVAAELMGVTATNLDQTARNVLHELVDYFQVDLSFLRRNDDQIRATILVAEWPPRSSIPDPDPLGIIYFADADSTFAATENLSEVMTQRASAPDEEYQERVRKASGVPEVSLAMVPLLNGPRTTGILGFIKYGDREWAPTEVNALRAVAGLLAQLQARVVAEERLRFLAYHDELTGLINRRGLVDHLQERLATGAIGPVALIVIDVDRLKALNSFLGHAAGDEFLLTLARRLDAGKGPGHFLASLGGDEFVLVMGGSTSETAAYDEAEKLREIATRSINFGGQSVSRAVSVGVALGIPGSLDASELLSRAEQAMLQAKSHGGNQINVFTAGMRRRNEFRSDIELHLRTAIQDGAMVLHYQPEVDLIDDTVVGFEALVRWQHPSLGLLAPDSFIDVVEATNLSGELARWVIETGCGQLKDWHRRYPHRALRLSMNISPAQLITLDFVGDVADILQECELDARYVTLEITEHAVFRDAESALITLHGLRAIGVRIAIDDFGTGYSSFAQLKSLPVDTLKIDQTFVRGLGVEVNDLAIVRSIIGLAVSFGLEPVAEGVETEITALTLISLGCRRAQGYLLGRPGSADAVEPLIAAGQIDRPKVSSGTAKLKVSGRRGSRPA